MENEQLKENQRKRREGEIEVLKMVILTKLMNKMN